MSDMAPPFTQASLAKRQKICDKSAVRLNFGTTWLAAGAAAFISCSFTALAQNSDGFWSAGAGGSWASPGNWDSGVIADGAGNTAYFGIHEWNQPRHAAPSTSRIFVRVSPTDRDC